VRSRYLPDCDRAARGRAFHPHMLLRSIKARPRACPMSALDTLLALSLVGLRSRLRDCTLQSGQPVLARPTFRPHLSCLKTRRSRRASNSCRFRPWQMASIACRKLQKCRTWLSTQTLPPLFNTTRMVMQRYACAVANLSLYADVFCEVTKGIASQCCSPWFAKRVCASTSTAINTRKFHALHRKPSAHSRYCRPRRIMA
jgi:hypothetical protein